MLTWPAGKKHGKKHISSIMYQSLLLYNTLAQ